MEYKLIIPYTLIGLNDYISAERTNRHIAAKLKAQTERDIVMLCKMQLRGIAIEKPVYMRYLWVERNKRRDKDNISSMGRKIIQDALVKAGILSDDGWKEIIRFSDDFIVDKANPRIEVIMSICEEGDN